MAWAGKQYQLPEPMMTIEFQILTRYVYLYVHCNHNRSLLIRLTWYVNWSVLSTLLRRHYSSNLEFHRDIADVEGACLSCATIMRCHLTRHSVSCEITQGLRFVLIKTIRTIRVGGILFCSSHSFNTVCMPVSQDEWCNHACWWPEVRQSTGIVLTYSQ